MKLDAVYARFYKSFNFDHLRKAHPRAEPKPWENYEEGWYPYIEIPIDERITTIVGANESGKSHLLSAIEKAVTGSGFEQRDLCRYSPFFNVEKGKTCWPHLGLAWTQVTAEESEMVRKAIGGGPLSFDRFLMFREGPHKLILYVPEGEGKFSQHQLADDQASSFGQSFLPRPFRIKPDVALPNSVSLAWLVDPKKANGAFASKRARASFMKSGAVIQSSWNSDAAQFAQQAQKLHQKLSPYFPIDASGEKEDVSVDSLQLARNLLVQLANVDPERLEDLSNAIADGDDGHAHALVSRINDELAKHLNFPKWWAQDRDFSLRVAPREFDLVFTIRDRTGTEYTFAERSSGLKYFLSYLIQSQSHEPLKNRREILLMDEPDAYLSAEAQQDLLRIFDDFAEPRSNATPIQVVYVTHSPFLIDKNHADRIRVLQKGKGFDGTRVIKNASQNHYEPLRSAFGAFVGESAFIGACNILVEGTADQVILSGVARLTRLTGSGAESDSLDLNRVVIVPCGSASQVPYMLYLIRGRDAEKPSVIVLLDSDPSGNDAAKLLRSNDKKIRRLIKKEYITQVGELNLIEGSVSNDVEIEDLIPTGLAVAAANRYLQEVSLFRELKPAALTIDEVASKIESTGKVFDTIEQAFIDRSFHLDKIGFARAIIDLCAKCDDTLLSDVALFFDRIKKLFQALNKMKRSAERDAQRERIGMLVDRHQRIFVTDYPEKTTRENALIFLEKIVDVLDDSDEADAVKIHVLQLKREFKLDEELGGLVPDFASFKSKIAQLKDSFDIERLGGRATVQEDGASEKAAASAP